MSKERNWKRIRDRLALQLPVRVRCRETSDYEWIEMTRLINVTPFGAGFTLRRPTEKGRLLHLTIPMPRQLRVFDHIEDQYRVWAIVRYMKPEIAERRTTFNVGVAFIGKRPPQSYEQEPWRRYDISQSSFDAAAAGGEILKPTPTADQRSETRYSIAVDMHVEVVDENGTVVASEQTVTEDISSHGASLFTTLDLHHGRFVRLRSEQYGVTAYAAIRSRHVGPDGIARLHVEFIDREWPL
jgi:hypothetical protein